MADADVDNRNKLKTPKEYVGAYEPEVKMATPQAPQNGWDDIRRREAMD